MLVDRDIVRGSFLRWTLDSASLLAPLCSAA
jgi:hypothetical protein